MIRPGGRAVITYFLLNDESRALVTRNRDEVKMRATGVTTRSVGSPASRCPSRRRHTMKHEYAR